MSWKKVKLCSVAKIGAGQSAPKDSDFSVNDGLPFIRAGHLEQLIANDNIVALPTINEEKSSKNKLKVLKKGSILFAKSGMSAMMNRAYLIEQDAYYVSHLASVTPNNSVLDSRFCYYFLKHFKTSKLIKDSSYPSIGLPDIENIEIPLPPLSTQKRIAEILDAADALRRKDQELLRKYDELAQAIFIDMFGDPVKNEKGWDRIPFAELFDSRLGKMLDAKKQVGGKKFKYLGNSNLQWFRFNLDNLSEMEFADNEIEKFELKKGDILICEGGEVGRCAIWNNDMPNVYFQKAIHRARAISNNITPEYTVMLFWFLAKYGGLNDYVTAATIAHLTGEKLKLIPIPVPPIDLQIKYRDVVLQLNKQNELFAVSQLHSENIFNSLLQQAFKGELVK